MQAIQTSRQNEKESKRKAKDVSNRIYGKPNGWAILDQIQR